MWWSLHVPVQTVPSALVPDPAWGRNSKWWLEFGIVDKGTLGNGIWLCINDSKVQGSAKTRGINSSPFQPQPWPKHSSIDISLINSAHLQVASPSTESSKVPWRKGTAEKGRGHKKFLGWDVKEKEGGKWAGITLLVLPRTWDSSRNQPQGFINQTGLFSLDLANFCGTKSDLKVHIHFSSLCLTTVLKYWDLLGFFFFSYPRNSKFLSGWNKWNHLLLPAVQFKPFSLLFLGLFPETWHESETAAKWEIHPLGPITISWNSTCKGRKIRLWFVPNAGIKDIKQRISVLFLIYKTKQRNHWVSSNFGVFLFIYSVSGFVA